MPAVAIVLPRRSAIPPIFESFSQIIEVSGRSTMAPTASTSIPCSLFSPQAASASAAIRTARTRTRRTGAGLFMDGVLSPTDDAPLRDGDEAEESNGDRGEDGGCGKDACRFQAGEILEDQIAQPGGSSRVRARPLTEDGSDDCHRNGNLRAAEEVRQRGRRLQPAEDLAARSVQTSHHLDRLRVHRAQAVDGVDRDREEADQRHDRQLRPDPEAEPDHQDWSYHDDRDRL